MQQIGAAPTSSLKTLEQTARVIQALLRGEAVTVDAHGISLDAVQMQRVPETIPPLYIGGMRAKTLQLAGRVADGTILPALSPPAYVRWVREQLTIGVQDRIPADNHHPPRVVVYLHGKVAADGQAARAVMRESLARQLVPSLDIRFKTAGIYDAVRALHARHGAHMAAHIPDGWIDMLCAAGTPEQAAQAIARLAEAGADAVILEPPDADPTCLDDYARYLMPLFN